MATIIRSPDNLTQEEKSFKTIFLAGGISNCPDWQKTAELFLNALDKVAILNPRRHNWNMDSQDLASIEQIEWEHKYLTTVDMVLFWFPEETLCPITLFELGAALQRKATVLVGVHPNYQRKLDVITQVRLENPKITVHTSLPELLASALIRLS